MVENTSYYVRNSLAQRLGLGTPSMAALGALAAWVAVIIYASSNSIVTLLVDIGEANPVAGGRNAITYTNLYLLGSLLSLLPMTLLYRRDLTRENLNRLNPRHWKLLGISAVLSSVVTPALFFYALEHTTVTNVVLVGRIEPPLFLLATWFFLRERLNPWAMLAGLTALAGAVVIIGSGSNAGMFTLGKGEIATIAATLSFIASTIVTRAGLRDVPLGIFAVFRTVIGASLYFVLVTAVFGIDQFQDVFEPIVWSWVWVYAIIVIVLGQIAWNLGLKHAQASDVSLATSFSPLAAILIAMVLLGEDPGPGLIPGTVLILIAIAIGNLRPAERAQMTAATPRLAAPAAQRPCPAKTAKLTGVAAFATSTEPGEQARNVCPPGFSRSMWQSTPLSQVYSGGSSKYAALKGAKRLLATAAVGVALTAPGFADIRVPVGTTSQNTADFTALIDQGRPAPCVRS